MGFDTSSMQSLLQKTDAMARHLVNRRFVIVLLCGLTGCSDPVDKAAKKRIFSPEDPPRGPGRLRSHGANSTTNRTCLTGTSAIAGMPS